MSQNIPAKMNDQEFFERFKAETKKELTKEFRLTMEDICEEIAEPYEFKSKVIRYTGAITDIQNVPAVAYIKAVYYCSIYAQGLTQVEAYTKVFPERAARKSKKDMASYASQYFHTQLVQSVWKQVSVADHMLFVEKRFKAYAILEEIMDDPESSRKERIDAASKLAGLLKPPKEAEVRIDIGFQSKELKALEEKLSQLADAQIAQITGGKLSNKDAVEAEIISKDDKDGE